MSRISLLEWGHTLDFGAQVCKDLEIERFTRH